MNALSRRVDCAQEVWRGHAPRSARDPAEPQVSSPWDPPPPPAFYLGSGLVSWYKIGLTHPFPWLLVSFTYSHSM